MPWICICAIPSTRWGWIRGKVKCIHNYNIEEGTKISALGVPLIQNSNKKPPDGWLRYEVNCKRVMGLDLGHRQALLALRAAQVAPGHQIPGREKASPAPFLIRPSSPLIAKTPIKKGPLQNAFLSLRTSPQTGVVIRIPWFRKRILTPVCALAQNDRRFVHFATGPFLLERVMGLPPALGQCRGQPGELKNHLPDGFLPACGRAVPFESHYPYEQHK